jgi:EAL domain-containing protein (putative c-di-GMP-specific phosphodiesterase class I)
MDDFGTGYSSLSYLRMYPFNILKIDKSFIDDITVDPADMELVNAAISMSHSLGLKVVAEGVEAQEQLELLSNKDCDYVQGYLFSKPINTDEFTKLLGQ